MKKIDIKVLSESKVFCTAPWTHLHTFPNGDVVSCCLSPAEQPLGNLNGSSIEEVWNSDKTKQLRTNMLEGKETLEICHRCYDKEREGFQSLRTGMNIQYLPDQKVVDVIESTQDDGTVDEFNLIHWDFRFSNLCNLSCRSCGPGLSSSWMKDYKKLYPTIPVSTPALEKLPEERNTLLLDAALKNIDKVKFIHFAGGEPMMMEEHWIILEELQKANRRDVQIRYSTNMTRFKFGKKHAFDYWHDFENVYISASIDDIGDRFNYLRNGGDWIEVEQNLKAIKDQNFKNLTLGFHPTLSIFNIMTFPDLVKYIWEHDNFQGELTIYQVIDYFVHVVNLNPLTFPDYYSMTNLPVEMKLDATKKIEDFIVWVEDNIYVIDNNGYKHQAKTAPLRSLIEFLNAKDGTSLLPEFFSHTKQLDTIRNQDLYTTFPDLKGLSKYE